MRVKYLCDHIKTDSIPGVGLTWEPGQEREVTAAVAERLLVYKDTWIRVEETGQQKAEDPIDLTKPEKPVEEPLPVINFHGMNKAALVEFAAREYNQKIDKRLSETTIRHQVVALFGKHQAELG